ncbi:hypothetical protein G5B00_10130 [Parapedobacter sp. SGR-10]|uniref:exo-alpha-sialidase n=1 Tax=Parapedobacter sp. SGR-10 TaxID=2710879 RepID=UPI0013D00B8E|nr:exo-alpha-sialidase [Parapedobacter sp. SGR-10]NGF56871.1 hypothetical protein [Parapedobacter sp. SGR-10]
MKRVSRRNFIAASSAFAASSLLVGSGCKHSEFLLGQDNETIRSFDYQFVVDRHITVYADHHLNAFPSVGKLGNGKLFLAFRQAPDWSYRYGKTDIDPSSEAVNLISKDGEVWDREASELYANFLHGVDRPVIHVLQDGSLFCTFFMWQVEVKTSANENRGIPIFDNWIGFIKGAYSLRSTDDGKSWDEPVALPGSNTIGRESVELKDGSILCSSYSEDITIYKTKDKGLTWTILSTIPRPAGYSLTEPTLYKTDSGKIVCFAKGIPDVGNSKQTRLITTETVDNGITWTNTSVRKVDYIGAPHLLRLNNGAVLLTYKYCHEGAEIRGAVLNIGCTNMDDVDHHVLRTGLGMEEGNTSAIMLDKARFLVVYSNFDSNDDKPHIAGTICHVKTNG